MKTVYLFLSRTNTVPARLVRLVTGAEYSHISIALEPRTDRLYSFARRKVHNMFTGGFRMEDTHTEVFKKNGDGACIAMALDVTDRDLTVLQEQIRFFSDHYDECTYHYSALYYAWRKIPIESEYKFTCSFFVAHLLSKTESVKLPKHPSLMRPVDFLQIPGVRVIFRGKIKDAVFREDPPVQNASAIE